MKSPAYPQNFSKKGNATWRFLFLVVSAFAVIAAIGAVYYGVVQTIKPTSDYLWPTSASRSLSSTFAETRTGHFHFGIDIRTNGGVGYPCYAVEDGSVVRLKVSPYGYGRALYLELEDGYTAVYAHLQRFAPQIEEIVHREQYRTRNYRCEMFFKPGEIHFKKGDVVAYSGASGVGGPHLHFEMRDANGWCNPFLLGFTAQDQQSPTPGDLAIFPLTVESEINQGFETCIYNLKEPAQSKSSSYALPTRPELYGPIGFGVSGFDKTDNASNSVGFYGFDLYLDDSLLFQARYDAFGYDEAKFIELERDFRQWRQHRRIFHRLWKDAQHAAEFYPYGDGRVDTRNFTPGRHNIRILVLDFQGNSAVIKGAVEFKEFPLYPQIPKRPMLSGLFSFGEDKPSTEGAKSWNGKKLQADFCDEHIIFSCPDTRALQNERLFLIEPYTVEIPLVQIKGSWVGKLPLEYFPAGNWVVERQATDSLGAIRADQSGWFIQPIKTAGGMAHSEDGLFTAEFKANDVYHTTYVRISEEKAPDESFCSKVYQLDPFDVPIRGSAQVAIQIPPNEKEPQQVGIYVRDFRKGWSFLDNNRQLKSGCVTGASPRLDAYALRRDNAPPTLRWLTPAQTTTARKPTFSLSVSDNLSGFDDRTVDLTVDGEFVLMEYDSEARKLFGKPERPLANGEHVVVVKLGDFCGNETSLRRTFRVVQK
ncbi:MAG: M23 family metallopeptidase [bacterium]